MQGSCSSAIGAEGAGGGNRRQQQRALALTTKPLASSTTSHTPPPVAVLPRALHPDPPSARSVITLERTAKRSMCLASFEMCTKKGTTEGWRCIKRTTMLQRHRVTWVDMWWVAEQGRSRGASSCRCWYALVKQAP